MATNSTQLTSDKSEIIQEYSRCAKNVLRTFFVKKNVGNDQMYTDGWLII